MARGHLAPRPHAGIRAHPGVTPQQYVDQRTARSGSSFYYAFLFVPPPRRRALIAYYALCREIDDIVDEDHDPAVAATKLAWWRREVAAMFTGLPSHPVAQALAPHCAELGIEAHHLTAVIDGCQMDLEQTRYLDFAGLERYCNLVAGSVGVVTAHVLGFRQAQTLDYAQQLGIALQLINIIRDVGDDARRGRIYLPLDELKRFGVQPAEILARQAPWGYSDRFSALMRFQAERARQRFERALALLPEADRTSQLPGLMMANMYRALLHEIEADDFRVLHQGISLTPLRKLWIGLATHWRGR